MNKPKLTDNLTAHYALDEPNGTRKETLGGPSLIPDSGLAFGLIDSALLDLPIDPPRLLSLEEIAQLVTARDESKV